MRKVLIVLVIVFQVLLLGYMAGSREYICKKGTTVFLRTNPVDPYDYFRGDYVSLRYEIEDIAREDFRDGLKKLEDSRAVRGKRVYAVLEVDEDNVGSLLYVTDVKPSNGEFFIRGMAEYLHEHYFNVNYGINSYYIQQGSGELLEDREVNGHRASLEMEIAVSDDGVAVTKGHRWAPLSIDVSKLEFDERRLLKCAEIELVNISEKPLAVVDLPGYASLKVDKAVRRGWYGEYNWQWVGVGENVRPADDNVYVLQPGEKHIINVDFGDDYWNLDYDEGGVVSMTERELRSTPFWIVYESPSAEACKGLQNSDLIWHGKVKSQRIPNWD